MKKILKLFVLFGFVFVLPVAASAAYSVDLMAGQHHNVGTVTVTDDGTVTYATIPGCVMTETHLHVAASLSDIPQTKKGSPIPGQFMYNDSHNPPVTVVSYQTGQCGQPLYIAAHAVVSCIESSSIGNLSVVSDTSVCIDASESCSALCTQNAVEAWEYNLSDPNPPDPNNSYWDTRTQNFFTGSGADWIWGTYHPIEPIYGEIVEFQKCFTIPGTPLSGKLYITTDNGYEAKLNYQLVGSAQLFGNWRDSLLTEPCMDQNPPIAGVHNDGWQGDMISTAYDVTGKLQAGQNSFHITGVNEAKMGFDTQAQFPELANCPDPPNVNGTIYNNPAGVIFKLDVTYATSSETLDETAWAAGTNFAGKNWATYFTVATCTQ